MTSDPSPLSCPRQSSLGRSLHLAVYPISVPIPILLLHHSPRNAPVIVCSSFSFTQSLPPSLPRSFTPASFPRLTRVCGCNWESTSLRWQVLLEKLKLVSFWVFSHNVISAHPSTSPSCFFYSPHFLSVRSRFVSPHLFQSWHLFFAHILSQMWFCRSSRFLPSPQGLSRSSLLLWTSRPLSISSSLFPPGSRNETGASCTLFIIFHTSRSLFGPPWWWCYHLLPPTHHPHRLPSASWSEGGRGISVTLLILWCFRQFWEADGRRSLSERSWCARDGGRETVTVGRRLSGFSGCFLESEQRGNTRKRNEKEEQKRIGTNERMGFLRLSAFPLKGLYI